MRKWLAEWLLRDQKEARLNERLAAVEWELKAKPKRPDDDTFRIFMWWENGDDARTLKSTVDDHDELLRMIMDHLNLQKVNVSACSKLVKVKGKA